MKRFLYLLISLFAISSCGVLKNYPLEQEYNEVWKGKTYNEIVMSFGAPVLLDGLTFDIDFAWKYLNTLVVLKLKQVRYEKYTSYYFIYCHSYDAVLFV